MVQDFSLPQWSQRGVEARGRHRTIRKQRKEITFPIVSWTSFYYTTKERKMALRFSISPS